MKRRLSRTLGSTSARDQRRSSVSGRSSTTLPETSELEEELRQSGEEEQHATKEVKEVTYKQVGGQQLTAKCMFCNVPIASTGATRIVDHFLRCQLCLPEVKAACVALRDTTQVKRKEKEESESDDDRAPRRKRSK